MGKRKALCFLKQLTESALRYVPFSYTLSPHSHSHRPYPPPCVAGQRGCHACLVIDGGPLAQAQLGGNLTGDKLSQVAARQVRTLGQSGDLLLVISVDGNDRGGTPQSAGHQPEHAPGR